MGWENLPENKAGYLDDSTGLLLYYVGYSSRDLFNLSLNMLKRGSL
jgi:hypothetical protein